MSISRVSTYQLNKAFSNQLSNTQSKFNQLAQQISSSVTVSSVSDNPLAAGSIIKANKQISEIKTYQSNIENSDLELAQVDNTLKAINDQLGKAHDLAMQVSNGTNGAEELTAYKNELDAIIDNVTRMANTQYNDKYLFSGTRTTTKPYTVTDEGLLYGGNNEKRATLVGEDKTQDISVIGKDVFGEAAFTYDAEGNMVFDETNSSGALGALYQFKAALQDTENVDIASVQSAMGKISSGMDSITASKTRIGAIGEVFEDMLSSYQNDELNLTELRSNLQDTDLPSAISDWYSVYQSMQASYSMMSQTMNTSLLNYI